MNKTKRKKRWGDLRYGRRLRSLDPISSFVPFIMPTRNDATNYFSDYVEVSALDDYVREKRKEGYKGLGILHMVIAAYVRTLSQYPGANRFVTGQRVYTRYNIEIIMTIKQKMKIDSPEGIIKVQFDHSSTWMDVYTKLNEQIELVKNEVDNSTDKIAGFLTKLPRFIFRFALSLIKAFDYYGKLPMAVLNASPFHGSLVLTDLGSLGIKPCFHHIYNFGNVPAFLAFGAKRKVYELNAAGEILTKKYIDYNFSLDERVCDGMYWSRAFKEFKNYLRHPEKLEVAPEKIIEDVD